MENALYANLLSRDGYGSEKQYTVSENTLLSTVYKTTYADGVIVKNDVTYLWSASNVNSKTIEVDIGNSYNLEINISDPLKTTYDLGKRVRVFYRYDSEEYEYVYHKVSQSNNIVKIDLKDIDANGTDLRNKTVSYFFDDNVTKKFKIADSYSIIYNSEAYKDSNIDLSNIIKKTGYVEFIDNNSDSKYDIVNVKVYDAVIVGGISLITNIVTDKFDLGRSFGIDEKNYTRVLVYDAQGEIISLDKIIPGSVLSVAISDSYCQENCIEIRVSQNVKNGKITDYIEHNESFNFTLDYNYDFYATDRAADESIILSKNIITYIDVFGNAVYIKSDYGRDLQYGLVLKATYRNTALEGKVILKMLTLGGEIIEFDLAEKVKIDGVSYKNNPEDAFKRISAVKIRSASFSIAEGLFPVRFQTDENNKIKILDTQNSGGSDLSDDEMSMLANEQLLSTSGFILGWSVPYNVDATVLEINASDFSNSDTYVYNYAVPSTAFSTGYAYKVAVFKSDPESKYADFIITLKGGVDVNTSLFVVEEVVNAYNEKEDIPMCKVRGYLKGTRTELWIDDNNTQTITMKDLKFGDVIRVASDKNGYAVSYAKVVIKNNQGIEFVQISGDGLKKDTSSSTTIVYGYVYDREGSLIQTHKFDYGIIPSSSADVLWDSVDKIYLNITASIPVVIIDSKTNRIDIGTVDDVLDYLNFGTYASKICARYRNSTLQEIYVFN